MLNKEQMFIVQEFVNKNANRNLWQITDKLVYMVNELIEIENTSKNTISNQQNKIAQPS